MDTTLGETAAATADQLGAEVLACRTGAGEVGALTALCTVGERVTLFRVTT
jgi:tRNA(Ile2) C34 agmatinyltransferase TiaS